MGDFGRSVYEVARKEVMQHIRTKRLLIIGIFFVVMLQLVTLVIPLAFGLTKDEPAADQPAYENMWFFFHLNASFLGGLFAIQLLCIVLTADAVCSEWSGRSIFLLLSKPVSRTAFVVGKYLGSVLSIVPTVAVIYCVQYAVMNAVFPGSPSGDEVTGFFLMLLLLALGAMAVASVALFFSTLTKSNVLSLILTLLVTFFLFPILGAIGGITYAVDESRQFRNGEPPSEPLNATDWKYDWSNYITPTSAMSRAPSLLIPHNSDEGGFALSGFVPQSAPHRLWASILSGSVFTVLFVGFSILRVNKRNFE